VEPNNEYFTAEKRSIETLRHHIEEAEQAHIKGEYRRVRNHKQSPQENYPKHLKLNFLRLFLTWTVACKSPPPVPVSVCGKRKPWSTLGDSMRVKV
jgi:hypothetical protein